MLYYGENLTVLRQHVRAGDSTDVRVSARVEGQITGGVLGEQRIDCISSGEIERRIADALRR